MLLVLKQQNGGRSDRAEAWSHLKGLRRAEWHLVARWEVEKLKVGRRDYVEIGCGLCTMILALPLPSRGGLDPG